MASYWMIIAFAALLMAAILYMSTVRSGYYKAKQELARKVGLFSMDHFISFDGAAAIAIDKRNGNVFFADQGGNRRKIVTFEDILSVELIEDGNIITGTSAGNRSLDRKIFDDLIAAVTTEDCAYSVRHINAAEGFVHRIMLRITVADVQDPCRLLFFWNSGGRGISKKSAQYEKVRSQADHWCARLQVIIKQADDAKERPRRDQWHASVVG